MYFHLNGILTDLFDDKAVIDCAGVGYLVTITKKTHEAILKEGIYDPTGDFTPIRIKVFIHHVVKEDVEELYGFASREECEIFKALISVSGLGPKGAIAILSTLSAKALVSAILSDNSAEISQSPGVGAKTAQKIIVELKSKIKKLNILDESDFSDDFSEPVSNLDKNEAIEALMNLGYTKSEATKVVAKCKSTTLEEVIKEALTLLSIG